MLSIIAQLLPFAVAGAFLPSWTSRVIVLLGTERPRTNSSAYVAGNATWRLALGFTTVFLVSVAAPESQRRGFTIPVEGAWTLATLLAVAGVWLLTRHSRTQGARAGQIPGWIGALKRVPPWVVFVWGAYNCALPGAQWVYFLAGCTVIASSGLAWEWRAGLLILFVALLESMLIAPILVYARRREEAEAVFARLETWLAGHATSAFGGILILMGTLFAYVALSGGQIGAAR